MVGASIALGMNAGLGFKYACQMYFKDVTEERALYPRATSLENAIGLSLVALAAKCEKIGSGIELEDYSINELYGSLCVLENQQFAPVPVLSRMWNISEANAQKLCILFSSMSLAKTSTPMLAGHEQSALHIHDLHLEYCRQSETQSEDRREWHRRLLS